MNEPKAMPGEDQLIKAQQLLSQALKLMYAVLGNFLPVETVTVAEGDTLWHLAETHLNDGQRWRELYFMNIDNITLAQDAKGGTHGPEAIYPGTTLRLLTI